MDYQLRGKDAGPDSGRVGLDDAVHVAHSTGRQTQAERIEDTFRLS